MGNRQHRRKPTLYNPGDTYFASGLLLCFSFGIILAGIQEAYVAHDWGWVIAFCAGEAGCFTLYMFNVCWWLKWLSLSVDDKTSLPWLNSWHEHPHPTGED